MEFVFGGQVELFVVSHEFILRDLSILVCIQCLSHLLVECWFLALYLSPSSTNTATHNCGGRSGVLCLRKRVAAYGQLCVYAIAILSVACSM